MPRKPRIHYTETDKAVMWDRWQKGDSLEKIAQLFDRTQSSAAHNLRRTGGIRPPNVIGQQFKTGVQATVRSCLTKIQNNLLVPRNAHRLIPLG